MSEQEPPLENTDGETEYAEAHTAPLVREIGGAMIGVIVAVLLLVQVGVL